MIELNSKIKDALIRIGTYEDLEEILQITFKMYEDFKSVLIGN